MHKRRFSLPAGNHAAWLLLITFLAGLFLFNRSATITATAAFDSSTDLPLHLIQPGRPLNMAVRAACQTAVEEQLWQYRLWPAENPGPKPALAEVMPPEAIAAKVTDALAQSQALAELWQQPITPAMLQAEIERQVAASQQPQRLAELWQALNNDPVLIAECLARPALARRLLADRYAQQPAAEGMSFEQWWPTARDNFTFDPNTPTGRYTLPALANARSFGDDTWTPTAAMPLRPKGQAVWTGSEMLFLGDFSTQGYRYNPAIDAWTTMTTQNAPGAVKEFTAVWTGTEMITWGGCNGGTEFCTSSSGGRYNPATDSWTDTTMAGSPLPRRMHGAVWTGSEMIIWGGCRENSNGNQNCNISLQSGGRYDPVTDSWTPTSEVNVPSGRNFPNLVWTGTEMILWSGAVGASPGGRYNPVSDSWQSMSTTNAPSGNVGVLVWSGSEMLAWGGCTGSPLCGTPVGEGGRYDPVTDSWSPMSTTNAPAPRWAAEAVWANGQMIVWGGYDGSVTFNDGARYDPLTDSWTAMSAAGAPSARVDQKMLWTGSEMLFWGGVGVGSTVNGYRYDPADDSWTPMGANAPLSIRTFHRAVWTGAEMIVWGGQDNGGGSSVGLTYDPVTDSWGTTSAANAPTPRAGHSTIWTGTELIVWGGNVASWSIPGDGGRYNPMTDSWTPTTTTGAPEAPGFHSAVWTGSEMIVFGGSTYNNPWDNVGGRYSPATDSWLPMSMSGVPQGRYLHTAVWSGSEMIIFGGSGSTGALGDGGRYNPATDSWNTLNPSGAPGQRTLHTAVWTGSEMIIWGGAQSVSTWVLLNDGARYNPATDSWTPTTLTGAPGPTARQSAIWTGDEMIVWGGCLSGSLCLRSNANGGRYSPVTDSWTPTSMTGAPEAREWHTAVWTGNEMIVWGGTGDRNGYLHTGGRYYATTSGNNAPQAVNDSYMTEVDTPLNVITPGILANDDDPDGDALTASLVLSPTQGTLTLQPDGGFRYTPDPGFNGTDTFSYQVSDGDKLSNVAIVTISVTEANTSPTAVDDGYVTPQDTVLVITAPGILANDDDPDGDSLTASLQGGPANGSLTLNSDGAFTYTPNNGFSGTDTFTYLISDGRGGSDTATVTITVTTGQFFIFMPFVSQ